MKISLDGKVSIITGSSRGIGKSIAHKLAQSGSNLIINGVSNIISKGEVNYLFGSFGKMFEDKFSKFHNIKYSVAVSNGTVGLELALTSLDIEKGNEVLVSEKLRFVFRPKQRTDQ
mgnify:CR=1 FL=1